MKESGGLPLTGKITLPPLPEPDLLDGVMLSRRGKFKMTDSVFNGYTASQVEQIRRDAVRAALGAALQNVACELVDDPETGPEHVYNMGIKDSSHAIRALMPKDDAAERVAAAGGSGLPDLLAKLDGLPDVSGKVADVMPKEGGK